MKQSQLLTQRRLAVVLALGLPILAVALYTFPPTEASYYPRCIFHKVTGWHCAGCGTARCLHALLHGQIYQAAAYNIFTLLALPFFLYWGARQGWARLGGTPLPRLLLPRWLTLSLVGLVFAFWILRNIPVYPLTLLAPHELSSTSTEQESKAGNNEAQER